MSGFIASVMAALRSLPRFIYERVQIAGQWLTRMTMVPSSPMEMAGSEPAAVAAQAQAEADEDTRYTRIVAGHLLNGMIPPPEISGILSETRFEWLCALTPAMLRSIVHAKDEDLRNHLRGRKALRGVLVTDPATVKEYLKALDVEDEDEPEWEPVLAKWA